MTFDLNRAVHDDGARFQLLEVGAPAFSRIFSSHERKRAEKGKWVFTGVFDCEAFAFNPDDIHEGIFLKGCADGDLLQGVATRLWTLVPDIGFCVCEVDGVPRWGFLCPSEEAAEFYEGTIMAWVAMMTRADD